MYLISKNVKNKSKVVRKSSDRRLVRILAFNYVHWGSCSIEDNISKRFDRLDSFLSKIKKDSSKTASSSMRLRFDDRFDIDFEGWFVESALRCCAIFEYDSKDCSFDIDLVLFQTMIHPHSCRPNMLRNWTGFGPFDNESELNYMSLYFLAHQIWPALHMKFIQNETDDVVISMNEEELSASSTMVLHVEFITISKESRHKEWQT
jgi:hypothetical protein